MVHVVKSKDPKVPPRMQLDAAWRPSRDPATGALRPVGKLWDFTEKIASARREGKNRRDGATVSSRVLRLTDELGRKLFADAVEADRGARGKGKGRGRGRGRVPSRLSLEEREELRRSVEDARRRRKLGGRPNL